MSPVPRALCSELHLPSTSSSSFLTKDLCFILHRAPQSCVASLRGKALPQPLYPLASLGATYKTHTFHLPVHPPRWLSEYLPVRLSVSFPRAGILHPGCTRLEEGSWGRNTDALGNMPEPSHQSSCGWPPALW